MSFFNKLRRNAAADRKAEEVLYTVVAREIDSGIIHDGLWLKALEKAGGNESVQTSEYVKLRVQSLKDDISIVSELNQIDTA